MVWVNVQVIVLYGGSPWHLNFRSVYSDFACICPVGGMVSSLSRVSSLRFLRADKLTNNCEPHATDAERFGHPKLPNLM
jgi:hypothetical protein